MAAIDLTQLPTGHSLGKYSVVSKRVDFSENNAAATDVVTLFTLGANVRLVGAWLDVVTAEGAACTVKVDAGATALFAALTDINAVAFLAAVETDTLTADTPVTMTMANTTANAVLDLRIAVIDLND